MEIISIIIGALLFGGALWGSIKIFDRYNSKNTIAVAAFIGLIFSFAAAMGTMLFALPLICLLYLLVSFYDLGLLKSFAVVGSMVAMNIALAEVITRVYLATT